MKKSSFTPFLKSELLNFYFSKVEAEEHYHGKQRGPRGGSWYSRRRSPAACLANHQFRFQGKCHFPVDPDMVEWSKVEGVLISYDEKDGGPPQCAICLDSCDTTSSRVTRCGHVYCWLCLLRHLSFEGASQCPTCMDPLFERDLKSVEFRETLAPKVGAEFHFRLCTAETALLTRYLVESKAEALAQLEAERVYLLALQAQCEDPSLSIWERKYEECYAPFIYNALSLLGAQQERKLATTEREGSVGKDESAGSADSSHFFQAANGDLVFLHPMNRKLLLTCDPVPSTISALVLEVEEINLDSEARKKISFLRHFPSGAHVKIVELDLVSQLESAITAPFLDDIQKRAARRSLAEKKKSRERAVDEKQSQTKVLREKQRWAESEARIRELMTGPRVGQCSADVPSSPDPAESPDAAADTGGELSPPPSLQDSLMSTIVSRGGNFPTLCASLGALPTMPPTRAKGANVWGVPVAKPASAAFIASAAAPGMTAGAAASTVEPSDKTASTVEPSDKTEDAKVASGGGKKKAQFKKISAFSNTSCRSYS